MEQQGIFGIMGTYGERDNKALFSRGMRTLAAATSAFELLAVQMYVEDMRHQYEHDNCTFDDLDKARDVVKKLMDARFHKEEKQ